MPGGLWVRGAERCGGTGRDPAAGNGAGAWGRDPDPPQGLVGSSPTPGKATQPHSPAARRPPRPGDGPGARGGCGCPSAAETTALASTPAASASACLRRPPSARTRPLLRSPRGLGSRQGQDVEPVLNPSAAALRTRRASQELLAHRGSAPPRTLRTRARSLPRLRAP